MKNFENPVEDWLHAQELKAAFVNSFKRSSFQNFKRNVIIPWIHVSALNSYLCTEFVNEMNSRKKTSVCFQRFMSGFYQINVAVSSPTEFNLEQNLHIHRESFAFSAGSNFNYNFHQYSLDGIISAESFSFLPEIFFVKIALKKLHVLWPQ